ncbi:hypothetical protein [Roseovarius dicentrarchi]|uniref:hypothetical protein n=1 Tax=Roseovarius dicentrarchi TaxID=2250573 RepID=UPI001EF00A52|nr:hypothetical protein [Roseovarius dicentrarchi]
MTRNSVLLAALLALAPGLPAQAQQIGQRPLSAIDWLDQIPAAPLPPPLPPEPPVAGSAGIPEIVMTPLGDATTGAVGLLPPAVTGLPADMWAASDAGDLAALWRSASSQPPAAIQALYHTLLLAEAEPPRGDADVYLRTRIAVLRRFGAVEPAFELLSRAGPLRPALFADWFDLSMLNGAEAEACADLRAAPGLLDDGAAQIYCTALTGDWRTAALLFETGRALDAWDAPRRDLLEQFLDPDMAETGGPPVPMNNPTPLDFRLFEAIGSPLPTRGLPAAFAMADLRGTVGWKAEIEAAERLARSGALAPGRLMGLYTRQRPAASGGVWDRAAAVQSLEAAVQGGAADDITAALTDAWQRMRDEGLEIAFAQIFGAQLAAADLDGAARALAYRIALLTPDYEAAAANPPPGNDALFLAGLAQGRPNAALVGTGDGRVIATAFAQPPRPAPDHALLIQQGKLGEAVLSAALQFDRASGDPGEMAAALSTLRSVGLEDTARRAALQALILDPAE